MNDLVAAHHVRWQRLRSLAEEYAKVMANFADWEIVVRFYSALHLVQAYFCTKNQRFEAARHAERWSAIRASPELTKSKSFMVAYRQLQDVSEQVRYDAGFVARSEDVATARTNLGHVESMLRGKVERTLEAGSAGT